jgi:hypothetical protein
MIGGRRLHNELERLAAVESKVFRRGTFAVDSILNRVSW